MHSVPHIFQYSQIKLIGVFQRLVLIFHRVSSMHIPRSVDTLTTMYINYGWCLPVDRFSEFLQQNIQVINAQTFVNRNNVVPQPFWHVFRINERPQDHVVYVSVLRMLVKVLFLNVQVLGLFRS